MPRFALASSPGSNAFTPWERAFHIDGAANGLQWLPIAGQPLNFFLWATEFLLVVPAAETASLIKIGVTGVAVEMDHRQQL